MSIRKVMTELMPIAYAAVKGNRKIAYRKREGNSPGIVFLPGYFSVQVGNKGNVLDHYSIQNNLSYIRFDYESIGESPGNFEDVAFEHWLEDATTVINDLTTGPQILVGSSMGAWLSLLATLKHPERVHSLILIGTAVNFFQPKYEELSYEEKKQLDSNPVLEFKETSFSYKLSRKIIESSTALHLDVYKPIAIKCPIRFLHAMYDNATPCSVAMQIAKSVASEDVQVVIKKDSNHQFSEEEDLKILCNTLDSLIQKYHSNI